MTRSSLHPIFALLLGTVYGANQNMSLPSRSVVSVVAVEKLCPTPEYELTDNDVCVLRSIAPAETLCRPGGRLENGSCYFEEIFPPEILCPVEATFNGEYCDILHTEDVIKVCEADDVLVNGECWKVEKHPVKLSCPKGYQLSADRPDRCIYITYTTPEFVCPPDFVRTSDDRRCDRRMQSPPAANCPPGTILFERMCVSPLYEAAVHKHCSSGGELDVHGRCVSVTSVDADVVCPNGYATIEGKCEKPNVSKPSLRCPKDFVLNGSSCVQTIPAEPYCPGERESLTTSGTCVGIITEPPIRACPQRSVPGADGKCAVQVIYENDLDLSCEDAFALVDGRCLRKVKTQDVLTCPSGYALAERADICELIESVEVEPFCPGTARYDGARGACSTASTTDVLVTCARGMEYNTATGDCQVKHAYHPTTSCPAGYSLKRSTGLGRLIVPECQRHEILPTSASCGGVGELNNDGRCVKTSVTAPHLRCPPRYSVEGDRCARVQEAPAVRKCPADFKQIGNACVGKIATEYHGPEMALSSEDRKVLQDAIDGASQKRPAAFRRAGSDKSMAPDAQLIGMADMASRITNKMSSSFGAGRTANKKVEKEK